MTDEQATIMNKQYCLGRAKVNLQQQILLPPRKVWISLYTAPLNSI